MGCDIHGTIDYDLFLTQDGKAFVNCFAGNINLNRNYDLFAVLADVRNDGDIICQFPARGVPENNSWRTRNTIEEWGTNGHSHSWLYVEEITKAYQQYRTLERYEQSWIAFTRPTVVNGRLRGFLDDDPKAAIVTERMGYSGIEYKVELGEKYPHGPIPEIEAIIEAMLALNGDNPHRSRFVFWFDN